MRSVWGSFSLGTKWKATRPSRTRLFLVLAASPTNWSTVLSNVGFDDKERYHSSKGRLQGLWACCLDQSRRMPPA